MTPTGSTVRRAALAAAAAGLTAAALMAAPAQAAPATSAAADDSWTTKVATLSKGLGTDAAGTYVNRSGETVVNVTNAADAEAVRDAGAVAKTVTYSSADLAKATGALDRSASITGTAWSVNPKTNQVTVSVDDTVGSAEMAKLNKVTKRFGDAVEVDQVGGKFTTSISGGDAIWGGGGRCSLGFNVTDGGSDYFLTAGHCTDIISSWYADSGQSQYLGPTVGSSFPGNDYGLVRHDGGVSHPGTVGGIDITGASTPSVGQTVTRRGSTTGTHSGTVTALNATVNYPEGTVSGLIRTTVCAEPGDSGGSLYSGSTAHGLTSGGNGNCSSGGTTYFQPVTEAMSAYGVSIL